MIRVSLMDGIWYGVEFYEWEREEHLEAVGELAEQGQIVIVAESLEAITAKLDLPEVQMVNL